jgi:hypothetical protein
MDPSKSWHDNEKLVYGKLIQEVVVELLPVDGCEVTRIEIEEILKTAHKNQRSKYLKLTDPNAKALYLRRIRCNNRNMEVIAYVCFKLTDRLHILYIIVVILNL